MTEPICTPEHCTQADVPMIFRTHTPRTCPEFTKHDGSDLCSATTCERCDCCAEHNDDTCKCPAIEQDD